MKMWLLLSVFGTAIGVVWIAAGQSAPPKANDVHEFMRAKLEHSKKVLEGLTIEDLPSVAKNAAAMSLLSQASNWQVLQTPEYLHRSQEFRRVADRLTEAATKKNLDGAALAYVELTMKCIDCHKYVRGVRAASLTLPERH
jgi:hypothetical protein